MTTPVIEPETSEARAVEARPSAIQRLLQFELTKKKVPRRELVHFSRQLSIFIRAGVPLVEALGSITSEMGNKTFKAVLEDMMESLQGGSTFSDAARAHPEAFPPYYLGIVGSAELTGNLDVVLDQLAEYVERDVQARRRIQAALIYPSLVFLLSIAAVCVMTIFVLPRFKTFFHSLHAKLPLATRILIHITDFLSNWWFLFVIAAALLLLFALYLRMTDRGRDWRDRILLRTPVVGDLVQHAVLERFCRVLASMVVAGVALPEAMQVTSVAANNTVYRRKLEIARQDMMRGEGLARPLAATGLFPASARQMFAVGEHTGTLDEQLQTAAVYFDRELDYKLARFTSLFEPAVIIFMGLLVGFVAISLVSAMYGIYRQVSF